MRESDKTDWRVLAVLGTVVVLLLVLFWGAASAQAQSQCAPYAKFVDLMERKHGERAFARFSKSDGSAAMTVWLNMKSGSWTLTIRRAATSDRVCILDSGEGFDLPTVMAAGDPA
jgi:4-amino-4-deoxy-L-arabinose transferase-like glycosyltransferase